MASNKKTKPVKSDKPAKQSSAKQEKKGFSPLPDPRPAKPEPLAQENKIANVLQPAFSPVSEKSEESARVLGPGTGTAAPALGGAPQSFSEDPHLNENLKLELVSILMTATLKDRSYHVFNSTVNRLKEIIALAPDKKFVAQAILYARHQAGMRSIAHLAASELAAILKDQSWASRFYERLVRYPEDAFEILSLSAFPLPEFLKTGLAHALCRFDEHQLAQCPQAWEASVIARIQLLHPLPTAALEKLVHGTLDPAAGWQPHPTHAAELPEIGDGFPELPKEVWRVLLAEKKLGYRALLRNLRNILRVAPETIDHFMEMLVDERLIRKASIVPLTYLPVLEVLQQTPVPHAGKLLSVLSEAIDISLLNLPPFEGKSLIALDGSGTMTARSIRVAALFAASLAKSNNVDIVVFSDSSRYIRFNPQDHTLTMTKFLESQCPATGTHFHSIFEHAKSAYDRILILSDTQAWRGPHSIPTSFIEYKKKYETHPRVFSFDLEGEGLLEFPEPNLYLLAGYSENTIDLLQHLDSDPKKLLKKIELINLLAP